MPCGLSNCAAISCVMSAEQTPQNAKMTPLRVCTLLIGPYELISRIVGDAPTSAYNWANTSGARDAGDIPSARKMRRLLSHSDTFGLGLTAEHLIRGASEDEINAILAARDAGKVAAE